MNIIYISAIASTVVMIIYYFTTFKEETKNETYTQFLLSVILFLLLYVAIFSFIFNILQFYKLFTIQRRENLIPRRTRNEADDIFASVLARRAPDPNSVINPLFQQSPQFLRGPFGSNNPWGNQLAYTFFND